MRRTKLRLTYGAYDEGRICVEKQKAGGGQTTDLNTRLRETQEGSARMAQA